MKVSLTTENQRQTIHEASLRVLSEVGVRVPHEETLSRFRDHGARVDFGAELVRPPAELVTRLLGSAGRQFTIYGWDTANRASFGIGERNYNSIAGEASWVDRPGGPRRYAVADDVVDAAKVGDALENITIVGAMGDPSDVPIGYRCVEVAATLLANTPKPITFWFHDRRSARFLVELAVALRGSTTAARTHPPFFPLLEPISPLQFPHDGVDLLYETSRIGLPVPVGPMAQTGLSAPGTLAGTMVQENAEILAGICITQIIEPGTPVCYGGICHAFDMATTQMIFAGPEQALYGVAMTEMGKHYGLPVYVNVGLTDSKRPDAQAGLESGTTLAFAAAAGADIFGHMGIAGVDQAASLDMLVLQDEIIGYVERCMRGVDFGEDKLGVDEIAEVGPGGTYIDRAFTARNFREEMWFPRILDRRYYDAWLGDKGRGGKVRDDAGAPTTEELARRRLDHLRLTHEPRPMPSDMAADVQAVRDGARRHLGGR